METTELKVKEELEKKYGKVYDTTELQEHFEVESFLAPYVVVREKATGKKGTLEFSHRPRFYFDFRPTE